MFNNKLKRNPTKREICNTVFKQTSMELDAYRQIIGGGGAHKFPAGQPGRRSALGLLSSLVTQSQSYIMNLFD